MPVIVGVGRSGTTLLRLMLDAHSDLAIPPETGFLIPVHELVRTGGATAAAVHNAMTHPDFWPSFGLDAGDLERVFESMRPFDVATALRWFYRRHAARQGKTRYGDKTPNYVVNMPAVERLLPEARFIHVIRDGRDVAVSVRPLWFSPGTDIAAIAKDWAARIAVARRDRTAVRHYLEIRFEALIHQPEPTLRRVCEFLELDYQSAMLDYHKHSRERLAELQSVYRPDGALLISGDDRRNNHRFTSQTPQPSRIGRWRAELTAEEVAAFHAVAGSWLDELGYEA